MTTNTWGTTMNAREKIIAAIERLENAEVACRNAEASIVEHRKALKEAERHLCHTLHAVQGVRSSEGVLFKGKQYLVEHSSQGEVHLVTRHVECEVLG